VTTGMVRMPRRRSSSIPSGRSVMLIDSNPIARIERNSLSFRQLVQAGCQNTLIGSDIFFPIL